MDFWGGIMSKRNSRSKLWVCSKWITAAMGCLVFSVAATAVNAQYKGMIRVLKSTTLSVDALANESVRLDQCANGAVGVVTPDQCTGTAWVNGNLGSSKSHYVEGESVPYRDVFG